MSESLFEVVFQGKLVDGFSVTDVKANVARLFKATPQQIEHMFVGKRVVRLRSLLTLVFLYDVRSFNCLPDDILLRRSVFFLDLGFVWKFPSSILCNTH